MCSVVCWRCLDGLGVSAVRFIFTEVSGSGLCRNGLFIVCCIVFYALRIQLMENTLYANIVWRKFSVVLLLLLFLE